MKNLQLWLTPTSDTNNGGCGKARLNSLKRRNKTALMDGTLLNRHLRTQSTYMPHSSCNLLNLIPRTANKHLRNQNTNKLKPKPKPTPSHEFSKEGSRRPRGGSRRPPRRPPWCLQDKKLSKERILWGLDASGLWDSGGSSEFAVWVCGFRFGFWVLGFGVCVIFKSKAKQSSRITKNYAGLRKTKTQTLTPKSFK